MATRGSLKTTCALLACGLIGCGSDSGDSPGSGGAFATGGMHSMGAAPPSNGGASAGAGGTATATGGAPNGGTAPGGGGNAGGSSGGAAAGGTTASGGTVATGGAVAAGGALVTGGTASSGGAAATGGGGGAAIPAPVAAPVVWGYGIGVTDLPGATKFFTEVMKVTVEKDAVQREDRTETILYASEAKRGARLVLMKFNDGRNTRKITAKLVWQSQSASAIARAASAYPDYVSRLNFGIVQFDGPETYIQEVGGIFDSGGSSIRVPYPIALGFVVSDQPASRKFYTALGMAETSLGSFRVEDATGSGTIAEYSVKFSEGVGVVLQRWTPERNAKDNPIKVILMVPNAKAVADKVVAAGGAIVKPAERTPVYDNRLLIVAKDLDGYVLEIVE